jgi:hypothetical protein
MIRFFFFARLSSVRMFSPCFALARSAKVASQCAVLTTAGSACAREPSCTSAPGSLVPDTWFISEPKFLLAFAAKCALALAFAFAFDIGVALTLAGSLALAVASALELDKILSRRRMFAFARSKSSTSLKFAFSLAFALALIVPGTLALGFVEDRIKFAC